MSGHSGKHRCSDPRCGSYDRQRIYKRIDKHSAQVISVFDDHLPFVYSIGLFENHTIPELFLRGEHGTDSDGLMALAFMLLKVADYLITLPQVDEGTIIPAPVAPCDLWLWKHDAIRYDMGIARDYYRDRHMRPLDNVPVFLVSPKPHPNPRPETNPDYDPESPGPISKKVFGHRLS
jgi:hypothetical protein